MQPLAACCAVVTPVLDRELGADFDAEVGAEPGLCVAGAVEWAEPLAEADLPISAAMRAFTCAGCTTTTLPTSSFANPSVGTVVNDRFPAVRFCICSASCSGLRLSSMVSDDDTALSSFCSLNGFSNVPPLEILRNAADRKYCCRRMRSRSPSPSGKP